MIETVISEAAVIAGLTVLAEARWPDASVAEPEPLPGFVYSSFSPLVAATAGRCLSRWYGAAPVPPGEGARVALILASVRGDVVIARAIAQRVDGGGRMPPLLFSQSVANAVLGHIAALWGIGGPLLCTSPVTDPQADALALAASVLADGDADTALVVLAEPACTAGEQDRSHALLVRLRPGERRAGQPAGITKTARGSENRSGKEMSVEIRQVDHVELYVGDAQQMTFYLCHTFDFEVLGQGSVAGQRSVLLGQGDIRLLLTSGLRADQPATGYVQRHGDGVATIGLRTDDAEKAFTEAVQRGARAIAQPRVWKRYDGSEVVTASVSGFGDVNHRFVQRREGEAFLPGAIDEPTSGPGSGKLLQTVDHFAVCVPAGELVTVVAYYQRVLGFAQIFEERIEVGTQAMDSKVVQDPSGTVTLTIIAPDLTRQPGQIDDFLSSHEGAGVQHIAFSTAEIATAVTTFTKRGVRFLSTPSSYYDGIERRLGQVGMPMDRLRAGNILVDRDHWGEMFQIFTESAFVRRTLFFELIERHGALTFGTNNIKALYEAKERERTQTTVGA